MILLSNYSLYQISFPSGIKKRHPYQSIPQKVVVEMDVEGSDLKYGYLVAREIILISSCRIQFLFLFVVILIQLA